MNSSLDTNFLAIGLIHRLADGQTEYLVAKKPESPIWSPIVGQRLEKETFRETITREIAWALQLDRKSDFLVSNMSTISKEYIEEGSDGVRHTAVAFYRAQLYSDRARSQVENDQASRWITPNELCSGVTVDQQKIEERVVDWINQWQVIRPWS